MHLLGEITATLPEDSGVWLQALRHHSLMTMLMRIADEHTRVSGEGVREKEGGGEEVEEREKEREREEGSMLVR